MFIYAALQLIIDVTQNLLFRVMPADVRKWLCLSAHRLSIFLKLCLIFATQSEAQPQQFVGYATARHSRRRTSGDIAAKRISAVKRKYVIAQYSVNLCETFVEMRETV